MTDPILSLKERLSGRSIYLIGMMGSGKTSTGRPLAKRLGYGFVDADAVIEQVAGCTIPEIFERDGEAGFRSIESQVLNAISQRHSLVVATGGGVVTKPENWGQLHSGIVVWLDVNRAQLHRTRLQDDSTQRPLLQQPNPEAALRHPPPGKTASLRRSGSHGGDQGRITGCRRGWHPATPSDAHQRSNRTTRALMEP